MQLGCEVTPLEAEDLARGDLRRFEAIVIGVRACNVRPERRSNQPRLLEYVKGGGTLYARYGQGVYVFTAYSWFCELPAGAPGAFRISANLLSAGKVLQ